MARATIEYCVPCGHLGNAIETQRALLETYGQRLDGVTLATGDGGVFEISVDGDVVFDTDEEGAELSERLEPLLQWAETHAVDA